MLREKILLPSMTQHFEKNKSAFKKIIIKIKQPKTYIITEKDVHQNGRAKTNSTKQKIMSYTHQGL